MDAYIVKAYRSAVAKAHKGALRNMRPDDFAAEVIKYLINSIDDFDINDIDDLVVGNAVPEAEQGMQMGRMISLLALSEKIPGFIVNRYCGSGLEAVFIAASRIHSGMEHCVIAGGTESMSMVPMTGYRTALNYKIATENPNYYSSMGITAEQVALEYKISREEQDKFAYESHIKAVSAIKNGKFKEQIAPINVEEVYLDSEEKRQIRSVIFDTDEGPRANTSLDALAKLKPVFANKGTVTAGNSSQTSDGAAFTMLMSEQMLKKYNLEPIAQLKSFAATGVDPRIMGIGPVTTIPKALKLAGLKLQDIEQIELNEAFAAQILAVKNELNINKEILNVNGGAIALGHPLGCSGTKLSVQLMHEMKMRKQKYGIVSACVGGGQGVAGVFEVF